jgi:TrmH family RNA methyltransferase
MKLLSLARDLRRRRARERQRLFSAEGIRTVEELLRSPLAVRGALVSPQLAAAPRGAALRAALEAAGVGVLDVSEADFASAADTESPQGVLAIASVPDQRLDDRALDAGGVSRLLVLDAVQDPGNVGTLLRTAAAFGVRAALALPGTVDLWNAKVVRSAMGAHFRLPALSCTWDEFDQFRQRATVTLWAADVGGVDIAARAPGAPERLAIAVGNEGAGISAECRARAAAVVAIPISAGVESLNVAAAAAVLLYELRPPSLRITAPPAA